MQAKQVDAIEIKTTRDGDRVRVTARVPPELDLLESLLTMFEVQDLDVVAAGVCAKTGFGTDYADVSYGDKGVDLTITERSATVPTDAFDRLMARLLRAAVETATTFKLSVTRAPWWAKAQDNTADVVRRAYPAGS